MLEIDLSRLTFMDCAGVHVLAGAAVQCARTREFQVTAGRAVERLLEPTGLGAQPWLRPDAAPAQR